MHAYTRVRAIAIFEKCSSRKQFFSKNLIAHISGLAEANLECGLPRREGTSVVKFIE